MLEEIIEKSYKIFGNYRISLPLDACTVCCMTEESAYRILTFDVREIPFDLLYDYNTAAKTAKTPIDEVKYFLPRFMDLAAQFEFVHHSQELTFQRLSPFDAAEWKPEELEILSLFTHHFFLKTLKNSQKIPAIDTLIMFHIAKIDIEPFLQIWATKTDLNSLLQFKNLILFGFEPYNPSKLLNAFGDKNCAAIIKNWVELPSTQTHFKQLIEKFIIEKGKISAQNAEHLSWTYELLR